MNSKYAIDYANIGLMILSCLMAFIIPFELFLFSYAVLGPLHYLTEIGWLHQRGYFTKGKYDFVLLIVFGLLFFGIQFGYVDALRGSANKLMIISFLSALVMVTIKDYYLKFALIVVMLFSMIFLKNDASWVYMAFGVFLPTLIHVFLFTAAFMLFGALKSKSLPGVLSVVVLFGCAALLFVVSPDTVYNVSNTVKESWFGGGWGFVNLNIAILDWLKVQPHMPIESGMGRVEQLVFHSREGFLLTRFVAFAYTYHYLNWFSKTNVIKWHKVPKNYLIGTVVLWAGAVIVYAIDYGTGLKVLFLLSFLHVLLEFPLNFQSFIGIGEEIGKFFIGKNAKA